jgi:hypothetical protein
VRYKEAESLCVKSCRHFEIALDERANFSRQTLGSSLTELGVQRLQAITARIAEAEKDYRVAQAIETEARIEKLHAEQSLQNWVAMKVFVGKNPPSRQPRPRSRKRHRPPSDRGSFGRKSQADFLIGGCRRRERTWRHGVKS